MKPFEKLRVADFTTMIAGTGLGRILSDLGADVIKIETPEGDTYRPVYGGFLGYNRGKRGIAMDLTKPEAKEIAYKLLATCQVVVENSRPGIMKKLGMDYESVKKFNPEIVYVSSTAFGTKGPDGNRPGYDPIFQAMSGQMAAQGGLDSPVYHKIAINDEFVPLIGSFGAACAIFHKMRTGQGQLVETSLLNSSITIQSGKFIKYRGMKRSKLGKPDIIGRSATDRLYQGLDGKWFYLYCAREEQFKALCRYIGMEEFITDPRFATAGARKRHDRELAAILQDVFIYSPAGLHALLLILAGVPAAAAQDIDHLIKEDTHCKETGIYTTINDPLFGQTTIQDVTTRFSETPGNIQRSAPLHGEHTEEVLLEIGYTKEQIADFLARKLVMQPKPQA